MVVGGAGGRFGRGTLLCCQQKHCFMYAAFQQCCNIVQVCVRLSVCVCACVRRVVFVLSSFGCIWPYLPVHRDELGLSKFLRQRVPVCVARARVCVCVMF